MPKRSIHYMHRLLLQNEADPYTVYRLLLHNEAGGSGEGGRGRGGGSASTELSSRAELASSNLTTETESLQGGETGVDDGLLALELGDLLLALQGFQGIAAVAVHNLNFLAELVGEDGLVTGGGGDEHAKMGLLSEDLLGRGDEVSWDKGHQGVVYPGAEPAWGVVGGGGCDGRGGGGCAPGGCSGCGGLGHLTHGQGGEEAEGGDG